MSVGNEFMKMTRMGNLPASDQQRGLPRPPLEVPYDGDAVIPLPDPAGLRQPPVNFLALVKSRSSVRKYGQDPLTLEELSLLLWCTQGIREAASGYTLRTVPSAGARHAFESYLLINRVEGLTPGLYRYAAGRHGLLALDLADAAETITKACLNQRMVAHSAVTFLWTADACRMTYRYGERGYRYLHLDAGHVCQNLYLAAGTIGCGVCAIAAFDDDALNAALGLNGTAQFAVYAAALGRKAN